MSRTDDVDVTIATAKTDDLVELLSNAEFVADLTLDQQLALARHRSVDVPRNLARHAAVLHEDTLRELAKSRIFTARRELVKNGGADLPPDVLDLLAEDEDGAVRNLVRAARGEAAPEKKRPKRRPAGEGFAAQPRAKLLELIADGDAVAALDPLAQVQVAQHRSVEVPRALARHAAVLHEDAQRALAESPIFTARRELVRNAGADLPADVLAHLSEDPDSVVRALVARVWEPDEENLPESIRVRRAELAAQIEAIRSASSMDDEDVDELMRLRDERLLAELADNTEVVSDLSPDRQVALAKHRSIAVPRTLARQSAVLSDEAIRELAQSPVFTARRALARYGLDRLDDQLLTLLSKDEDAVVRKLVADRLADESARPSTVAEVGEQTLQQQAEAGDVSAIAELGMLAWTRGDVAEASQWLEQAAGLGDALAMLDLETIALERGDQLMADHWLKSAAEAGHAGAIRRYTPVREPEVLPDYSAMNLRDLSFAGQDLSRANFSKANLEGVDLSGATLTGADFSGARLEGADLSGAILNAANFSNARAADADFTGANASRALFHYADLTRADFRNASVRDADFYEATVDDIELEGADTDGALRLFANWDMELSNGDFGNRCLLSRDFSDVPKLRGGNFRAATLDGSTFTSLDLTGASFINAMLIGVDFTNAILAKVDFTGAILVDAKLAGADLAGADFRNAIFTKAQYVELQRDADVSEALQMINELDALTGGDGEDGYSERADEIEEYLATGDKYEGIEDADFTGCDLTVAKMPTWWLSDNGGAG